MILGFVSADGNSTSTNSTTCSIPTCDGVINTGNVDANGCAIYACPTTPTNKCTDTDGGKWYYIKGSTSQLISENGVKKMFTGFDDQCINSFNLREGYCEGDKIVTTDFFCPYGCNDGRCVQGTPSKCDDGTIPKCELNGNDYVCETCTAQPVCAVGSCGFCDGGVPAPCSVIDGKAACSSCPPKKVDMEGCLNMPNSYWDQETDSCIGRFRDSIIKSTCSDPDGGMNIFKAAHTYGFRSSYADDKDKRIRTGGSDACISDKQIVEHYCDNNGYIQTAYMDCTNGCINGVCTQVEITPTNTSGPVELPVETYPTQGQEVVGSSFICNGCVLDKKCYPLGFRKDKNYCDDITSAFTSQKVPNTSCENSFECDSNLCINNQCVSGSLWQKILDWFSKLFGGK